jgi:hypothetical protein
MIPPEGERTISEFRFAQYLLLLDLAADLVSPDHYGHEIPAEVIRRTVRILKHARPPGENDAAEERE